MSSVAEPMSEVDVVALWRVLRADMTAAASAEVAACLAEPDVKLLAAASVTERPLFVGGDGSSGSFDDDDDDVDRVWLRCRTKRVAFEDTARYWLRPRGVSVRFSEFVPARFEQRERDVVLVSVPAESFELGDDHPGFLLARADDIALAVASAALEHLEGQDRSELCLELFDGGTSGVSARTTGRDDHDDEHGRGDDGVVEPAVERFVSSLNAEQSAAVASIVASGASLVWGPPGCGKTTVIAAAVAENLVAGRSTLVVSNNNIAVDGALLAAVGQLDGVVAADDVVGDVVRVGSGVRAEAAEHPFLTVAAAARVLTRFVERSEVLDAEAAAIEVEAAELAAERDAARAEAVAADGSVPARGAFRRVGSVPGGLGVRSDELDRRRRRLVNERSWLADEVSAAEARLVQSAPVVGSTLAGLVLNRQLLMRRWDTVIVDEAAAAVPFLVAAALTRADRSVAVVGDFRQNAPVTRRSKLVESAPVPLSGRAALFADGDVFELAGVVDAASALARRGCVALCEQFRFPSYVADVVNEFAYDGLLRTGGLERLHAGAASGVSEMFFVDTDGPLAAPVEVGDGGSRWWRPGLVVTEALLARHADGSQRVGVIVPYVAQAAKLNALVSVRSAAHVEAGTIHECQGREWPVVIFDLMQDSDGPVSWASSADFAGGVHARAGARILNVALTRMRERIYVVGSWSAVLRLAGRSRPGLSALVSAERAGMLRVVPAERAVSFSQRS